MIEREKKIENIIARMTLEQKLGQMFMGNFNGEDTVEKVIADLKEFQLGGLQASLLFKRFVRGAGRRPSGVSRNWPLKEVAKFLYLIQEGALKEIGVPIFIGIDQEGGVEDSEIIRQNATIVPIYMGLGATCRTEDAYWAAKISAREAKVLGVNMFYGPVLDLATNM